MSTERLDLTDGAEEARRGFADRFGRQPEGIWAAPGRANLIGEHTDYNDGFVLPLAIHHRVTIAAARRACTARHVLLLDTRSLAAEQVPFDPDAAGLTLLVIDTRVSHALADGLYAQRRRACEEAAHLLGLPALRDATEADLAAAADLLGDVRHRRARHVVTENARVLEVVAQLRAGRPDAIGALLTASHESLRDDYEVSAPELDTAVEAALTSGALGARMTGAGFGGCALALAPAVEVGSVTRTVTAAFANQGFQTPTVFAVHPAHGARRLA